MEKRDLPFFQNKVKFWGTKDKFTYIKKLIFQNWKYLRIYNLYMLKKSNSRFKGFPDKKLNWFLVLFRNTSDITHSQC